MGIARVSTVACMDSSTFYDLASADSTQAKRGREEEAAEVLCAVFDLKRDDPYILEEMAAIRGAISLERTEGSKGYGDIFKSDALKTRRRVILAWFGLFINQISGINLVVYCQFHFDQKREPPS